MQIGDLVRVKDKGISLDTAKKYLGHTGVIVDIDKRLSEATVFINDRFARFLPRYIEVVNESR